MARFNVFLDTNVFIKAKYDFTGASLNSLKKHCQHGTVELFTNEIVVRELKSHIDADVGLLAKKAKNAIKDHKELVNAITLPAYQTIENTLLDATNRLTIDFEDFMDGAVILSNDGLSMVTLFDNYFGSIAPFENREKKKSEFPDAVVIMSIKRYIEETDGASLHVVTDDCGWHNALKDISGIYLYKDLKSLLTEIAKEEELYTQIAEYMGEGMDSLQSLIEDWFVNQDWSSSVDNIEMCVECDEVEDICIDAVRLVPDGVEYIDREAGRAIATFSCIARVQVWFSYVDHTREIYDREDHVWLNTIYGKGKAEIEVSFAGSVEIMISDEGEMDFDLHGFGKMNLEDIEILEYELNPYRKDDDLYFNTCPDCAEPIGIHNDGGNGFCINCAPRH